MRNESTIFGNKIDFSSEDQLLIAIENVYRNERGKYSMVASFRGAYKITLVVGMNNINTWACN